MTGPTSKLSDLVRNLWASVTEAPAPKRVLPEVIIHDPEAQLPHDLDDPFFDRKVQERMADVIAHAGDNKK